MSKFQPFRNQDRPEILLDGTFNQKTVTTFETKSDDGTKSVWTLVKKEGDGGLKLFLKIYLLTGHIVIAFLCLI